MNRVLHAKAEKLARQIAAAPRTYSIEPSPDREALRDEATKLCDGAKVTRINPVSRERRTYGERERHGRIGVGFLASCMSDWDPAARCEIVRR
jgi:hypothetical protein